MIHISQYITQEETERIRSDHQYFIDKCKEEYRITEEDDKHVLSSFLKEQIKSIQKKIRKTVIDREADRLLHQLYPNTSPSKKQRNKVHKRVCSSAEIKSIMQKEIAVNKEIAHYNKLLLRMDISEFNNADVAAFRSYKDNILNRLQAKIDHPYDESHSVLGLNYFEDVFTRAIKTFFDDKGNEIMEKALSLCEKFLREEVCPDDLIEIIVDRYIPFDRSEITDDNAYDYIMQEIRNGQFYLEEILNLAFGREYDEIYGSIIKISQMLFDINYDPFPKWLNAYMDDWFSDVAIDCEYEILDFKPDWEVLAKNLEQNPEMIQLKKKCEREKSMRANVLKQIPSRYADMYPSARLLHRHFVLHVGPTNSGKTYSAVKKLRDVKKGIYLGPLRLLAFEQYEKLNSEGILCSLVTGEENIIIDGAGIQSSTTEILNFSTYYDVIVLDEGQMLSNPERGGAWTAAIMGGLTHNFHICLSEDGVSLVTKVIEDCGDTYEIIRHKRFTPLEIRNDSPFEDSIIPEDGDALICFSRRDVHTLSAELNDKGILCSMIYGAMPYDVRQNEAKKFKEGKTKCIVSTDAIGMGMNLPVRRVVFMRDRKYDGRENRVLSKNEILQIAGRAGRYGMHEIGYVSGAYKEISKTINTVLKSETQTKEKIIIDFPRHLLCCEGNLSEIVNRWNSLDLDSAYCQANTGHLKKLVEIAEEITDDKELQYNFASIPFDEENANLLCIWKNMITSYVRGEIYSYNCRQDLLYGMEQLENEYKNLDLYYVYLTRFAGYKEDEIEKTIRERRNVSKKIMDILNSKKLERRTCKLCGRILPWNYPYGYCNDCYMQKKWMHGIDWDREPSQ